MKQPEGQGKANRLARETSPYLLQHAHNPVDWYPWGPEAFAAARRRNVPIFLSIGYSTCYWCHVMERESFEDEATARVMNERFVCVKVDREERPDVDDIYMAAVQITTGRGGWPMSVFLEPEKLRPFWCGTYFPARAGNGMPSFTQVLEAISVAWKEKQADIVGQSELIAGAVRESLAAGGGPVGVGAEQVTAAVSALLTSHDRARGGFSGAPKFPQPTYLELLLAFLPMAGDEPTRGAVGQAVRRTLDRMAIGGMNDQVGGGFHRYSVDAEWLVPHFEKMLYDNAQLASLYARASRVFEDSFYARVARRTLDYVRREMTSPEGGFASAQDAEVDGKEGKNYLWTPEEVSAALGPADRALALRVYGLEAGVNFRDPHHPEEPPSNVLRLADRPEAVAGTEKMEPAEFLAALDRINEKLYAARSGRKQPRLDDKVLAGWNGLMIGAMAAGGTALGEPAFVRAAARSADFVLGTMRDGDGGLLRSFRAGSARIPAFLEDYAFLVHGLIELHRAGGDGRTPYLDAAFELSGAAAARFGDGTGGYFDTRAEQEDLFVRTRTTYDGAIPCGSSVMLNNLVDLFEVQGERAHFGAATGCLASLSAAVARSPVATANATRGLLRLLARDPEAVAAALPAPGPVREPAVPAGLTPVVVFASEERVTVSRDAPAALSLRIRIAEGYHINAADPGPGGQKLIPLRVGVTGGTGLKVYADYPKGESFGAGGEILIHKGELEFQVVLEREGEWSGRPILVVTWQVCTETECLAPTTVELAVAIDRGD